MASDYQYLSLWWKPAPCTMNNELSAFLSLSPLSSMGFFFLPCWCEVFCLHGWKWWSQFGPCFWVAAAWSVVLKYSKRYFAFFWSIHQTRFLRVQWSMKRCFVLFACCRSWGGGFFKRWQCGSFKFDSAAVCSAVEMKMVTLQKNVIFQSFTLSRTAFVSLRLLIITGFDSWIPTISKPPWNLGRGSFITCNPCLIFLDMQAQEAVGRGMHLLGRAHDYENLGFCLPAPCNSMPGTKVGRGNEHMQACFAQGI